MQTLREAKVVRITTILHLDWNVDGLLVNNMFEVQFDLVDIVADVV